MRTVDLSDNHPLRITKIPVFELPGTTAVLKSKIILALKTLDLIFFQSKRSGFATFSYPIGSIFFTIVAVFAS
jgi:hypothetical protein